MAAPALSPSCRCRCPPFGGRCRGGWPLATTAEGGRARSALSRPNARSLARAGLPFWSSRWLIRSIFWLLRPFDLICGTFPRPARKAAAGPRKLRQQLYSLGSQLYSLGSLLLRQFLQLTPSSSLGNENGQPLLTAQTMLP